MIYHKDKRGRRKSHQVRGFGTGAKLAPGRYKLVGGDAVPVGQAAAVRKHDSKRIRSVASGCAVEQVPEFNRLFGHMGVHYDPTNGDAIYNDRNAKLRVLKAREYHDNHEVRG